MILFKLSNLENRLSQVAPTTSRLEDKMKRRIRRALQVADTFMPIFALAALEITENTTQDLGPDCAPFTGIRIEKPEEEGWFTFEFLVAEGVSQEDRETLHTELYAVLARFGWINTPNCRNLKFGVRESEGRRGFNRHLRPSS